MIAGLEPIDFAARGTPLQPANRLGQEIGLEPDRLFIKRDDLTGLVGGGNKARKLEYLVADALRHGAHTLVTTGAAQSNHVRATGAAARARGLECVAVLSEREPHTVPEGNLVLDDLLGIEIVWTTYSNRAARITETMRHLSDQGRRPYEVPIGGSSVLGSAAYTSCAEEVMSIIPDATIVCADGSGGTHAGLVAGMTNHGQVLGFDVGGMPGLREHVVDTATAVAELTGRPVPGGELMLDHSQAEVPYGEPTDEVFAAIRLTARTEGLVLDPVYTGRAMAGLISRAANNNLPDGPIVFVHTGGQPALYSERYRDRFAINLFEPHG